MSILLIYNYFHVFKKRGMFAMVFFFKFHSVIIGIGAIGYNEILATILRYSAPTFFDYISEKYCLALSYPSFLCLPLREQFHNDHSQILPRSLIGSGADGSVRTSNLICIL